MTTDLAVRPAASLAPLPPMTLEEWAERGQTLLRRHTSLQWDIAVWLTDGEDRWPESIQIAEEMGVSQHRIHQSRYIVNACRALPSTVDLHALPFWHWESVAAVPLEDREAFALRAIELQPTQKALREMYREYKALRALPAPEQPQFGNGLAANAQDDGLPLAPHGVTRGGDAHDSDTRVTVVTAPAVQTDETAGATMPFPTPYVNGDAPDEGEATEDPYADQTRADAAQDDESLWWSHPHAGQKWLAILSEECRHQIELLRRYYREPDMTAAQVIERAIGQLCRGALKKRLERFKK